MALLEGLATWDTLEEGWLVAKLADYGRWRRLPINGHYKRASTLGGAGSRISPHHFARYVREVSRGLVKAHRRYFEDAA